MSTFTKKDWVCLVDEELKTAHVRDKFWREIAIVANEELISVRLGNVDREAANGGYWTGSENYREHRLTWDDLHDLDGISRRFEREQVIVFRKIAEMISVMREHMAPLRAALAA